MAAHFVNHGHFTGFHVQFKQGALAQEAGGAVGGFSFAVEL